MLLGSVTSNWSVNVNLFFFCFVFVLFAAPSQQVLFIFLTLVLGARENPENRSVWISVLCRHKFHLLQINSSEIIATAVIFVVVACGSTLHCGDM